jgi:hypothetical protein
VLDAVDRLQFDDEPDLLHHVGMKGATA